MNLVFKNYLWGLSLTSETDSKFILENNIIRRKTGSHYKRLFIMRTVEEVSF